MEAQFVQAGLSIDYTPGADVSAGDVIVQGGLVGIATHDIPANKLGSLAVDGVFDVTKKEATDTFDVGDDVYWEDGEGATAALGSPALGGLMGRCIKTSANGDTTVRVRLSQ